MKNIIFSSRFLSVAVLLAATLVAFQNCSRVQVGSNSSSSQFGGDSYPGMTGKYVSIAPGNPCNQLSTLGHPFPQNEIFVVNGVFNLVRQNCQDITPQELNPAAIVVDSAHQTIAYGGTTYGSQPDLSEFNLVKPTCPTGTSINTALGNLFADPLDLTAVPWQDHSEITASLADSIQALPNYMLQMTDPNQLGDWVRVSQNTNIQPNTTYVATFLISAGNVTNATIQYYISDTEDFVIGVDLVAKTASVIETMTTTPNITNVQPYGNGIVVSVAFTTSSDVTGAPLGDIGVGPYRPSNGSQLLLGDYVYATAASLYNCQ